mgnify:CR=1 FL=1
MSKKIILEMSATETSFVLTNPETRIFSKTEGVYFIRLTLDDWWKSGGNTVELAMQKDTSARFMSYDVEKYSASGVAIPSTFLEDAGKIKVWIGQSKDGETRISSTAELTVEDSTGRPDGVTIAVKTPAGSDEGCIEKIRENGGKFQFYGTQGWTDIKTSDETDTALNGKVDKVAGKGLSANDYTDDEKAAVAKIPDKVDKVTGKGLSANDYTDSAKSFLEKTVPKEFDRIDAKIIAVEGNVYSNFKNKVDKVAGKGLSTNDYTDDDKNEVAKVSALPYATLSLEDYDTRKRGHIAADGEYTASGSWFSYYFYTDKYPIKKISAKLYSNSAAVYSIAFYSAKDSIASNLISGEKPTAAGANLISFDDVSVPENAALIVISTRFASGENSSAELFVNLNIPAAEMSNIGDTSEKTGQIKRIFTDFPNANDFTFVNGELWGSGASGDTTVIKRYRITDAGLLLLGIIKTDFGHLNTFDYNPANDCLIFGNGANDFSTEGNWFAVVKNPMGLVTSEYSANATLAANAIVYNVDIGFKVQAVWGGSNLGLNNIVYLLSNNAKTAMKVLLNVDDNGEFNGQFTVLDTHTSETAYPVGGAKFWGDTLYFGYSDTGYKIAKMSMSDYSVSVTKRQLYEANGTEISGTVQGLHIDDKYVWVFINAVNPIRYYLIQMYQCLGSLSGGSGGAGTTITVDAELSATSENPVQNKAVKAALDKKIDEPTSNGLVRKYMSGIYGTVGIDAEMPASPTDNSVPSTKLLKEKLKNALGLSDADLKKPGLLLQTYTEGSTPDTVGVTGYMIVQREGTTLDDTITGMAKNPSSYAVGKYVKEKITATTPSINESGNWVIGTTDTGVSAKGIKGDKGDKGDTGAKGADGKTPVKGTDYFTEADKQELVNAVIAALPNGNGVAY